jgi:hypothetical protein
MWDINHQIGYDWSSLKESIKTHGLILVCSRAYANGINLSQIMGSNECSGTIHIKYLENSFAGEFIIEQIFDERTLSAEVLE